jgi:HK97 family phage portal protein
LPFRPLSWLKSFVRKLATPGERFFASLFPAIGIGWPGGWSQNRHEQVQHFRQWTYVAIDAIATLVAQQTPNLAYCRHRKLRTQKGDRPLAPRYLTLDSGRLSGWGDYAGQSFLTAGSYYRKALSVVKPHEDLEPLEYDHPLRRLLEEPNPLDTPYDLWYELDLFLELCGIAYLWAAPNGLGLPCELWVIPSHWVWPRTGAGRHVSPERPGADRLIEYYEVRPYGGLAGVGMKKLPASEVIAIRRKSPLSKVDGYSPLAAAALWIDTEESIGKSRWHQMQNQALPGCFVELSEGYDDPDQDLLARLEAKFASKFAGEGNVGRVAFGTAGMKVTPLSFSPEQMMYLESENQVRDMILSVFRVPKAAVGISESMTFGSILATLSQFTAFAINPRLAMLGQTLTKFLASRFSTPDAPVRVWWDDCSPIDPAQLNSDIAQDLAGRAITPNEIRALRGRKPYAHGGDDPLVPGPGGDVPLPLNTGEDWSGLGDLVPTLGGDGAPGQLVDRPAEEGAPESDAPDLSVGIDEPNGGSAKGWAEKDEAGEEYEAGLIREAMRRWATEGDGDVPRVWYDRRAREIWLSPGDWNTTEQVEHWTADLLEACDFCDVCGESESGPPAGAYWSEVELPRKDAPAGVAKTPGPHAFSSTQLNLDAAGYSRSQGSPVPALEELRDAVADEDLAEAGRETELHITALFGIHSEDPDEVRRVVAGFGPVHIRLGQTSCFDGAETGKDYDVVKVDVESEDLHRLHALLAGSLDHAATHPEYHPHVTLCYVRAGLGDRYAGRDDALGLELLCNVLRFSDRAGNVTLIPLTRMAGQRQKSVEPRVPVFTFGTLLEPRVRRLVFDGQDVPTEETILPGHKKVDHGDGYTSVEPAEGATVPGLLLFLTPGELDALDAWEDRYLRREVELDDGRAAWVYELRDDGPA